MKSYYNENDPYAAQWLRNLIEAGHIAKGDVDERSITDVEPADLTGYTQCHFFAGIGGWSYALRLAGWPDERPVWTGSCPCQPFSQAGEGKGVEDERHLWPVWFKLIQECCPRVVFGEQVDRAVGHGWLDGVCTDMEIEGYTCGAAIIPACAVDAPHKRDRIWFVAHAPRSKIGRVLCMPGESPNPLVRGSSGEPKRPSGCIVDNTFGAGLERHSGHGDCSAGRTEQNRPVTPAGGSAWSNGRFIPCWDGKYRRFKPGILPLAHGVSARVGRLRAYGNAIVPQVAAEFIKACFLE